jgi:hypothetical protein
VFNGLFESRGGDKRIIKNAVRKAAINVYISGHV